VKVKVTLCERAPRPLSLFNFTHLWFHVFSRRACPSFGT